MNELKKIRATKYKNKQRYKDKSKVISKVESKNQSEAISLENKIISEDDSSLLEQRGLTSNWYRYEPKGEDSVIHAKDFSLIASAPISQDSYFQFRSDKIMSDEVEGEQVISKLFHLDLEVLNKSLATIPFYERCDIEDKYLMEFQVTEMEQKAKESINFYKKHLEKIQQEQESEKELKNEAELSNDSHNSKLFEKLTIEELEDNYLQRETGNNLKEIKESEDLEQWLDNILDD